MNLDSTGLLLILFAVAFAMLTRDRILQGNGKSPAPAPGPGSVKPVSTGDPIKDYIREHFPGAT